MNPAHDYIQNLLKSKGFDLANHKKTLFEQFANDEANRLLVQQIIDNQKYMLDKWTIINRVSDIDRQTFMIPNGTTEKPYSAVIDFTKLGWTDFIWCEFEGLEEVGLAYNDATDTVSGLPTKSGDFRLKLKYRLDGEPENSVLNEKKVSLIINPNPKSLWKDLPSDETAVFWKPDNVATVAPLGKRNIVVSSKRGRSHANIGSFRDDDFAFEHLETGWSVVAVSDGAGSAVLSREGSRIACQAVVDYFKIAFENSKLIDFELNLFQYGHGKSEENTRFISQFVYKTLAGAAHFAHKQIQKAADENEANIKDFHATLIFTLFKTYDFGTAVLSFGVGDCPIAVLNPDLSEVQLMNWLDVGEFGGGTRFITMPEIFSNPTVFPTRFKFTLVPDFSYLMLMTDGIYDPKFSVEANLEKPEKWAELVADLKGNNADNCTVNFAADNTEIATELSNWVDFWSPGNHDDRTLAIVF
jgi:serine/threonine protein phosphatase PrpC